MDKRTLLLVIAFTLAFIGLQMYFQNQNQEEMHQWNVQKQAKLESKKKKLEEEILTQTMPKESLHLVELYPSGKDQQSVGWGVLSGEGIISLQENMPDEIRVVSDSKELGVFKKKFTSETSPAFSIYTKSDSSQLKIGELNYFGSFDLQLVNDKRSQLAKYVDGVFVLPAKELQLVYFQIDEKAPLPPIATMPESDALVLFPHEGNILPVGIYDAKNKAFIPLQTLQGIDKYATVVPFKQSEKVQNSTEKFYVLENAYQQLVFSSRGAALAEINLPLKDKSHPNSIVMPIELDEQMVKEHPANERFPSHPYLTYDSTSEHTQGTLGGYYPLIRRDFFDPAKRATRTVPPQFYSANIVSDYPELAELNYTVKEFTKDKIVFEAKQPFRKITKTYKLDTAQAPYCFTLDIQIDGDNRSLWLTTGIPEVELISNAPAPTLKYRFSRGTSAEVKPIDLPQEAATYSQVQPDWICNSNGFFGIILDPLSNLEGGFRVQTVPGETVLSRLVLTGLSGDSLPGYMMMVPLKIPGGKASFRFFAGPFGTDLLESIDKHYSDAATGYNPDYIASQTFHGWFGFISGPFAKFLFFLMNFFHTLTGSWGLSIILLTVALRIMLYPLNAWSMRSSTQMQTVMPEVTAIQERHKKDPKKAQEEIIKIYRERGINPLSGCLPLLIQIPFLIGMFDLLKSTFELRGACFIPGWINNLAAPDVLFSWSYSLPIIGNQFHLLPILTGIVMFLQQRWMSPAPKDPTLMTDKDRQQKAMGSIFALMFTFMFYNFPSGINIYWISTTFLGILQQWWTKRTLARSSTKTVVIQGNKR